MRALKIVGLVVGVLVGLLVIGVAALLLLVDPNDYRDDIEQRVERATGRKLQLAGELHLKLFPWIALEVADVTLGNPPGYGDEPFLTVRRADVGVKLMPLLRKQIEVRRITLDAPMVTLVSRSEEENNWKDLTEADQSKEKEPNAASPLEARIAGVDVHEAMLLYRDEEKKEVTRLVDLDLKTGALGGSAPVPVRLTFKYDDGSGDPPLPVAFESDVQLPKEGSRIELKNLVAKAGELSLRTPSLVLDTEAETLAPVTFAAAYGDLPIKLTASGEKLFSDRVVTGDVAVGRVSLRKLMPSFDMEVPKTSDPTVLTAFALKTGYRLTEKTLQLTNLEATLDDTSIRGKLAVDDLDSKALSFDLGIDTINVDRYLEPDEKAGGAQKPDEPTELPIEAVRKLTAHGVLRIGHAQLADLKFNNVRLPIDAAGGRVVVMPQAQLFGGAYNGDILLDARGSKAKLSLNEKVRGIDIGSLVNAAFDTNRVTGRGDANAVLTGTGNTDAAILASLSGKIDANVKEGAFNGVDLWYELRRALALFKRTPLPTRTEPVHTQFKTLAGSATLADGVVRNDDLNIDADYLKARGKGTLGIATQAVNYRLVAEIYKIPAEGAGAEMADLKAIEIPIAITGTLADMKVRPDVADLLKARVRKEVDKKVDKKKEELKKKLDEKLKDLLGG